MRAQPNRRELLTGAAAGLGLAAGAGLGAGGGLGVDAGVAEAATPTDAELLTKTLEVERLMVLAYERVLASGALSAGVQRAITPYLAQEREHLAAVAAALARLGAPASTAPMSLKDGSDLMARYHAVGSLTGLHTQHDCLKLLIDVESVAEGAAYTPIRDLRQPELVHLCAQIMACEAQHWTMLTGLSHPGQYVKAVPWPYVFGTK